MNLKLPKAFEFLAATFVVLVAVSLLLLSVKGKYENGRIQYQTVLSTDMGGPFETSGTNSRYALVEALVNDQKFDFTEAQARFASPDVSHYKGKYFTLFTPGVSMILVPAYILGKYFNSPQLFTFGFNSIIALFNFYLVFMLSKKLGASKASSLIAAFLFLFGTNALAYAQTLTQHHLSVSFILLAIFNAVSKKRTVLNNLLFGLYCGTSLLIDFPNPLMLIPVGFYVINQHVSLSNDGKQKTFSFNLKLLLIILGMAPVMAFYGYYNKDLTGSYTQIAQFIGRSAFGEEKRIKGDPSREDILIKASSPILIETPFKTRKQLNGIYTLLISDERSWIYYSPIVLLGFFGLIIAIKDKATKDIAILGVSVIMFNVLFYSLFSDPWGGWAFGPRYLIPSASILSAGLGRLIDKYRRNFIFLPVFLIASYYSIYISILGANTSQLIPPKVEAVALATPIPHTYKRNLDLIDQGKISSLAYNGFVKDYIRPAEFINILTVIGSSTVTIILLVVIFRKKVIK